MAAPALWKVAPASAEGSEWEGEYRGTAIRLVRVTDLNVWPGRNRLGEKDATTTRWDGYVLGGFYRPGDPRWDLVAECYGTRREALAALVRHIDGKFEDRP